ncbi:MAG: ABC transporter ATP-binding protein [Sphingomonadaceae bacterium]
MTAAIRLAGLEKVYQGGKHALRGVDLEVPRGSIFGLLGPNGAGKSTLINILAGLVVKTAGTAEVWGFDIDRHPRNARVSLGVVPQELLFDTFFTPWETLELQAGLFGVPPGDRQTTELLRKVRLEDKAHAYARTLSGGMKRRLLIAKALVHRPPVVILDEPTAGVDIELRQMLWDYVRELHAAGTTIVLTTHYLEEAEELCDRIAIVNHGRIVVNTDKHELLSRVQEKRIDLVLGQDLHAAPVIAGATRVELTGERSLSIVYDKTRLQAGAVLAQVRAAGLSVVDVSTREADLEDVFLQLTGEPA